MAATSVLMVRPVGFAADAQTAEDNFFQSSMDEDPMDVVARARAEFDAVVDALSDAGIGVEVFEGKASLPDDIFPNNWFSTFQDGTLVLYPMRSLSRRGERRLEIIDALLARYPMVVDLTPWEDRDMFLEGTGSLVLDHENRIAFAGRSWRTSEQLVRNWCADFEFDPVIFDTSGPGGRPVYHTNVLMAIGTGYAIVCTECIDQPSHVLSALFATDREVIEITRGQMTALCGNVLELDGHERRLIMSATARDAFSSTQLATLQRFARPLVVEVSTIEKYGGGGVRCMLAELW